jgi:hypothetical protein
MSLCVPLQQELRRVQDTVRLRSSKCLFDKYSEQGTVTTGSCAGQSSWQTF